VVTRRTIRYVTAIRLRANGIIGNLADQTTTSPASTKPALARTLGLWDLVLIGVIMVQPTAPMPPFGIFYQTGRGHVVTTVLIAMVAMLFTAINYGRMARAYPGAGSAYTYVGREIHPALGFATGWSMMLDYLVNPLICTIWCAKAAMNLVPQVPYAVWATLIAVLFTWMNLRRIRTTARVNEILAAAMGVVIIWMLGMSVKYLMGLTGLDTAFFTRPFYDPQTFSIPVILTGTSLATLTYIGFDGISTLSEEVHNPRRNVLLATVLICLIIGVLSAIEVYAGQLVWPRGKAFPDVDTAYAFVAQIVGGRALFVAINLTILVASIGSGAGGQLSGARVLYSMGREHALPARFFGSVDARTRVPAKNVLLIGALSLAGAFLISYEVGAELLNFGAFIGFMGVNMAAFLHYWLRAGRNNFLSLGLPPLLGFGICLIIWLSLPTPAKIAGATWLVLGIAFGAWRTQGFKRVIQFDAPSD